MNSVLRGVTTCVWAQCVLLCLIQPLTAQESADEAPAAEAAPKPIANSPLVIEPTTPEELFDATVLMVELARPDVAKSYLNKFLETSPSDELLLQLREKHGPAVFLKLSNIEELQPESIDLLKRNNAAFTRFARDPQRLDSLLNDLVTGTSLRRVVVQEQLRTAGSLVVPTLVSAFSKPAFKDAHSVLIETLASMRGEAVLPLMAALDSPDPGTRQAVIQTLSIIRDRRAIPNLLRFAGQADPSDDKLAASKAIARILGSNNLHSAQQGGVATQLLQTSKDHLLGKTEYPTTPDKLTTMWQWDEEIQTVKEVSLTVEARRILEAQYFARAALDLAPDRADIQAFYLNALLAGEVAQIGVGAPLPTGPGTVHDLAEESGADTVALALGNALDNNLRHSALANLQILSKIGSVQQVRTVGGRMGSIQRALNARSRRVQLAAAETILTLDPDTRYPGSDRVVSILGRTLSQAEASLPRALVLDAVIERGQSLSGFLQDMGYDPTLIRTGREGFKLAAESYSIDLILVDANIQRWALTETMANFKADPRTKDIPTVIFGTTQNARNVRMLLHQYPNVIFIEEPTATEDLRIQITPFLAAQQEPPQTVEERSSDAVRAATWLAHIASGQRLKLYNLTTIEPQLLAAAETPQLAPSLLPVLGTLPTVAAQRRLADLVGEESLPPEVRVTAIRQLTQHVRRHGYLITREQLVALRSQWRGTGNDAIAAELAAFMGVLRPDSTLVGDRLRNAVLNRVPPPAVAPAPGTDAATEAPAAPNEAPADAPAEEESKEME